jgi:hypothetical protein
MSRLTSRESASCAKFTGSNLRCRPLRPLHRPTLAMLDREQSNRDGRFRADVATQMLARPRFATPAVQERAGLAYAVHGARLRRRRCWKRLFSVRFHSIAQRRQHLCNAIVAAKATSLRPMRRTALNRCRPTRAIDPRTARTYMSLNHPAYQRDSRRESSRSSTSRGSHRSAVPVRIAGGPSPRRRHARIQPTLTVSRSANSWIVRSSPGDRLPSNNFEGPETLVTFPGTCDAAIVFPLLWCLSSWDHRTPLLGRFATKATNFAVNQDNL